jgi:hypothetical protein
MIDTKYQVRRYITEFSEIAEKLLAEYELSDFDLEKFQKEFGVLDPENPMFDCYPIKKSNVDFIKNFIHEEVNWDFVDKCYFVEAHTI